MPTTPMPSRSRSGGTSSGSVNASRRRRAPSARDHRTGWRKPWTARVSSCGAWSPWRNGSARAPDRGAKSKPANRGRTAANQTAKLVRDSRAKASRPARTVSDGSRPATRPAADRVRGASGHRGSRPATRRAVSPTRSGADPMAVVRHRREAGWAVTGGRSSPRTRPGSSGGRRLEESRRPGS